MLGSRPQHIRADDWSLDLPVMLAQTMHSPPFPVVNENIYLSQNMMAPIRAPTKTFVTAFQPSMWGFFFGRDVGISWLWWFGVFGVFVSSFFFFQEITERDRTLSLSGALLIVFSPFFQLWSFHKAEVFIGALLSVVFLLQFLRATSKSLKLLWAVAFGWALGEFTFGHIYPPYQVTLGYLCLLLSILLVRKDERLFPRPLNIGFLCITLGLLFLGIYSFLTNSGDALSVLSQTEYPGKRFSTGGGFPFWAYFSNSFFLRHWATDYGPLANICESAFAFFLFPGLVTWVFQRTLLEKKIDSLSGLLVFSGILFLFYSCIGFPNWLSHLTLFSKATSNRLGMPLLLIDISLLLRILVFSKIRPLQLPLRLKVLPALLLGLFLIGSGFALRSNVSSFPPVLHFVSPVLFSALLFVLLETRLYQWGLRCLIGLSFLYTMSFVPIVRGGTAFLYENPLSKKILSLHANDPRGRWAGFGLGYSGDLLRLLGVPSIGGYQGVPNFSLWSQLDPAGSHKASYNLAGLVYFEASKGSDVQFDGQRQVMVVKIQPESLGRSSLGIRYFLVPMKDTAAFDQSTELLRVFEYGHFAVYQMKEAHVN